MSEANKILIVEDSPPNLNILAHFLAQFGYDTIKATDGLMALEILRQLPDDVPLVGIFSDIMMPNMDGMSFLGEVKKMERFRRLFFVFTTAVFDKEVILKAKELGVNGYILKPISYDKVEKKVEDLVAYYNSSPT